MPEEKAPAPLRATILWPRPTAAGNVAAPPVKPHRLLATAPTPDGAALTLHEHDGTFSIRLAGRELMHSTQNSSERVLGDLAAAALPRSGPGRVLIGGLGLGFTLRQVLELAGREIRVDVSELLPAIVDWNREFLEALNGKCLRDSRVELHVGDVVDLITRAPLCSYDVITLDIDNGPSAMVQRGNARLYDERGLRHIARALRPGGRLIVWSAGPDRSFQRRLAQTGYRVELVPAKLHAGARQSACVLFVGDRPKAPTATKPRAGKSASQRRPHRGR